MVFFVLKMTLRMAMRMTNTMTMKITMAVWRVWSHMYPALQLRVAWVRLSAIEGGGASGESPGRTKDQKF